MEGITTSEILGLFLKSVIEYWVLIAGLISILIGGIKYLSHKVKQDTKNNNLLEGILQSTNTMSKQLTNVVSDFKTLRKEHDLLYNRHENLEKELNDIKRG